MNPVDDTASDATNRERRLTVRESVLRRGKVAFGTTIYDVIVLDQSEGGVRASSAIPLSLPETFVFHIGADMAFTARLRWYRGTEFGAALIAPRAMSDHTSRRLLDVHEVMRARNFAEAYARLRECDLQADVELRALLERAEAANAELAEALQRRVARG
jgi:hypothetical protein